MRRCQELRERIADVIEIRIDVQMIGLDVGHHANRWCERQKGAVVFVRLDDEQSLTAQLQISIPGAHPASGDSGRIQSRRAQHLRRHDRRRSLAMRARNAHHITSRRRFRERFGSSDYRNAAFASASDLRVVARHRRSYDERPRGIRVRRIMPAVDRDPQSLEIGRIGEIGIATCDTSAAPVQQLGERGHAGTSDADEMNRLRRLGEKRHGGREEYTLSPRARSMRTVAGYQPQDARRDLARRVGASPLERR